MSALVLAVWVDAAAGRVVTIAGSGRAGYRGDDGPAPAACLQRPSGLARGPDGALYVSDTGNHVVRRIASDGTISTWAGTGRAGYAGDGGVARLADLNEPCGLRFDAGGTLYIAERGNHVVRLVDARGGIVGTFAGTGRAGFAGDNGPAAAAEMREPSDLQMDGNGNVYVCDTGNHRLRRIDATTRTIATVAGSGEPGPSADRASLDSASLRLPVGIDFDAAENAWLVLAAGAVCRLDLRHRTMRVFAPRAEPPSRAPSAGAIAVARDGTVVVADAGRHALLRIDPRLGAIAPVAGTGTAGDGPDGEAARCALTLPSGVVVEADGTVLFADAGTHRVRRVTP